MENSKWGGGEPTSLKVSLCQAITRSSFDSTYITAQIIDLDKKFKNHLDQALN